jgi:hypothetical protein
LTTNALPFDNAIAVLATMHGKERVVGPVVRAALGLDICVPVGLDTDRFGTFSRDVDRTGVPLDDARAKIEAAFEIVPNARVRLASEGSFGPHPYLPFAALDRELVLLIDQERGLELAGHFASAETNYGHAIVTDAQAAMGFAERSGFPGHGLIVMGCVDEKPAPAIALVKDICDRAVLKPAVADVVAECGAAFVEPDMRAHRNPTRMRAIEHAAQDLVRRFRSQCPACAHRGFDVTERIAGLPCAWCREPTEVIRSEVVRCQVCQYRHERPATDAVTTDPGRCESCNP